MSIVAKAIFLLKKYAFTQERSFYLFQLQGLLDEDAESNPAASESQSEAVSEADETVSMDVN